MGDRNELENVEARRSHSRSRSRSRSRGRSRSRSRSRNRSRDRDTNGQKKSLLVKNLSEDVRGDELKTLMSQHGEVRDVYIPLDYYTRRPRGFAFVEFLDSRDAAAAKQGKDGYELAGRAISVHFAKENRKTPQEMRRDTRRRDDYDRGRRDHRDGDRDYRGRGRRDRSDSRGRDRRRRSRSRSRSVDRRRY